MELRFECPKCRARYQAVADRAGRSFSCQKCGEVITVPPIEKRMPAPEEPIFNVELESDSTAGAADGHPLAGFRRPLMAIAVGYGVLLVFGWIWPIPGTLLMLGWMLFSLGVTFTGVVLLFRAMTGKQRFWMFFKLLLPLIGLKLFYIDPDLWNRRVGRAAAWFGVGLLMLFAGIPPTGYFVFEGKAQLDAAKAARLAGKGGGGAKGDRGGAGNAPAARAEFHAGPPGFGAPPPGFGPPVFAGMPPGPGFGVPGGPPGGFSVRISYERLAHDRQETVRRADAALRELAFYVPKTFRVDERSRRVEFFLQHPPMIEQIQQINAILDEAGVTLPPRGAKAATTRTP
jgi:hypothetical protein